MENKRFILLSTKENGCNSSFAENGEDYRLIPLTQGKFAIVDVEDYDRPRNTNGVPANLPTLTSRKE